jgi:hypothetical protein
MSLGFISTPFNKIFVTLAVVILKVMPFSVHTKYIIDRETKVQSDSIFSAVFSTHQGRYIPCARDTKQFFTLSVNRMFLTFEINVFQERGMLRRMVNCATNKTECLHRTQRQLALGFLFYP